MNASQLNYLKNKLKEFAKNISPCEARKHLIEKLGINNKDGSLCKQYGGKKTDEDHPVHSKSDK